MASHTFVIPVYQTSVYLETCIQHLLAQTVKSKIIITTSTSDESTSELAKRYDIPYIVNPIANAGIAADWNFALACANTPLVTLAHQDDIYKADYTCLVCQYFERYAESNPLIAFTDYQDLVDNKPRVFSWNALVKRLLLSPFQFNCCIKNIGIKKAVLQFGDPVCCPTVTFNKAVLGNFTFDKNYQCALDWLALYQLAKREGAFIYINKKLVQHRIHAASATHAQLKNGIREKEEKQIFEMIWGRFAARLMSRFYSLGHRENL